MNLIDYYQEWYECFYKNLELVKKTNPFLLNPEYKDRCETMLLARRQTKCLQIRYYLLMKHIRVF